MADILATGGWTEPGSVGAYLGETLPDQFVVVVDPIVAKQTIDAIVVGPHGITIVAVINGTPVANPTASSVTRGTASGTRHSGRSPSLSRAERETQAVQAFLHDEFPALRSAIRCVQAQREPDGPLPVWKAMEAPGVTGDALETTIVAEDAAPREDVAAAGTALVDDDVRQAVAIALRDRQLTTNQRATHPFVFRSSTALGGGTRAWTIKEVVAAMDRNPADGIYHLRNGSLEKWFEQEGAPHLAALVRAAVQQTAADQQMILERFLLSTGLLQRPLLVSEPREVDLGYLAVGEQGVARLRLTRGKGRGYLFGKLDTSDPWLTVEPRVFNDGRLDTVVMVDTTALAIHAEPYLGEIYVDSSASPVPLTVPVHFRVVPAASTISRRVTRPLAGFLVAGGLGALVGALWALSGVPAPLGLQPAGLVWVVWVALLWGALGALRGAWQPVTWPPGYALRRCLPRLAAWAGALVVIALGITGAVSLFTTGTALDGTAWWAAALCGLTAAIFPATLGEARHGHQARMAGETGTQPHRRRGRWWVVAVVLVVLLVGGLLAGQRTDLAGVAADVGARGSAWFAAAEQAVGDILDQFYVRTMDRRAAPAPTVEPTTMP